MSLVLTAEQTRAVDRAATARFGVPSLILMENAGRGVADIVGRELRRLAGARVAVVCGGGQNGGDGFVIARHLANRGAYVRVLLAAPRDKIAGDAAINLRALDGLPRVALRELGSREDRESWERELGAPAIVVDALFGTGLRADVTGVAAAAIAAMNECAARRVAVDLPSGLDADTGKPRGVCVRADLTATMGARKLGPSLDPMVPTGPVEVVDLGVPIDALADAAQAHGPLALWLDRARVAPLLPRRGPTAHKGAAGHLLLIAGSPGKTGAAALAARGALRAGAGLVTVASTRAGQAALDAKVLEAMTACYADGEDAADDAYDRLAALADGAAGMRALVLGPGIPTGPGMADLVRRLARSWPRPMVIDADGLNLLGAQAAAALGAAPAPRVITPHPGEMARLCGVTAAVIQADRLGHARAFAARSGAVVVLKGARTLIARPDGTAFINPAANPSLATAGSGDVLAGIVGALLAQGLTAVDAAGAGVFVHGLAAEAAGEVLGSRRIIAGDLPDAVARVLEDHIREDAEAPR